MKKNIIITTSSSITFFIYRTFYRNVDVDADEGEEQNVHDDE